MCGRFVISHTTDDLVQRFALDTVLVAPTASYNVAPTDPVPVVVQRQGKRLLDSYRWGLVPFWAKDPKIGARMINARLETVAQKPAFKHALSQRRCLVPASGYYEWLARDGGKVPHFISAPNGQSLALAGLWENWRTPEGEGLKSCTIITRQAEPAIAALHDRMPAMLATEDQIDIWLDEKARDLGEVVGLLEGERSPELCYHEVSTKVNKVANNCPELTKKIDA